MGTSNWQNIPFCVDIIVEVSPQRVLDIGVGFGRWGMIVREFCDVWRGRPFFREWSAHIEGVEIYPKYIASYHKSFYDKIHICDAAEFIGNLKQRFDLVIFGDVLEHFPRNIGEETLKKCLRQADYMLINVPLGDVWPQDELHGNIHERHESVWNPEDFEAFPVVRKEIFLDNLSRPFGTFVLSAEDPKDLRNSPDIKPTVPQPESAEGGESSIRLEETLDKIRYKMEYEYITRQPAYILSGKIIESALWKTACLAKRKCRHSAAWRVARNIRDRMKRRPAHTSEAGIADLIDLTGRIEGLEDSETCGEVGTLAIYSPRWLGVSRATRTLFKYVNAFPARPETDPSSVGSRDIRRYSELLLQTGIRRFVFSGGDMLHFKLASALKKSDPGVICDLLWHGSYWQFGEDYSWFMMKLWIEAARRGLIRTVGTVKKGMQDFFREMGVRSKFVMNYVPVIPDGPSIPESGGPHLGLWLSSDEPRKTPCVMISAVKMIPGGVIHGSNFSAGAKDLIRFSGVQTGRIDPEPVSVEELPERIRKTHLSLYVTFSECAPMLPLESLSLGVPCLIGPNSHLFEDNDYLFRRLVVPFPDRADVIASHIQKALDERDRIIEEYIRYAPEYNQRAKRSVEAFIGD